MATWHKGTGEQSNAENRKRTSTTADYGKRITGRPPDGDPTVPSTSKTAIDDVPAGIANVVPTVNDAATSRERTSTAADYGKKFMREPPTTPIVETVDEDEDIPNSDPNTIGDNDDDEKRAHHYM